MTEVIVYEQLARYLRVQYPNIIYKFNHEDARKRGFRLQYLIKLLQSDSGYPDLFIAEPRDVYHGLFLEIKAEGVKTHKKDGSLVASQHIRKQAEMLDKLSNRGYLSCFASGFDEAKKVIDDYMKGSK